MEYMIDRTIMRAAGVGEDRRLDEPRNPKCPTFVPRGGKRGGGATRGLPAPFSRGSFSHAG